jgi:hypothetical protein
MSCEHQTIGPEEAETERATTLEFGVWVCGITSCKHQARSLRATATLQEVGGWGICVT